MKHKIFHKSIDSSSNEFPYEGIFWMINDDLISFHNDVYISGKWFDNVEHIKLWDEIKNRYKINGKVVEYNYFPRGRVMVNPIKDNEGKFTHYDVYIYIDNCINSENIINEIKYEFRLNKPNCKIKYIGADGGITSNHYTCHNCRKHIIK